MAMPLPLVHLSLQASLILASFFSPETTGTLDEPMKKKQLKIAAIALRRPAAGLHSSCQACFAKVSG